MRSKDTIILGQIGAPQGIKGAMRFKFFGSDAEQFLNYTSLFDTHTQTPLAITSMRPYKGDLYIITIDKITSRKDAENIKNHTIGLPKTDLPTLSDEDDFYYEDLIGLTVFSKKNEKIGTLIAVHNFGADDLLEIKTKDEKSFMLAFTKQNVPSIHLNQNTCIIELPDEINAQKDDPDPDKDTL